MNLWYRTALINFLIAALFGVVLRFIFIGELPGVNYRHFLHTHSHVAMLGWVYQALYAIMIPTFLGREKVRDPFFNRLFWLTQASVIGMLLSFPFQGYGPVSITFSTAHILFSYIFAYRFWREQGATQRAHEASSRLIRIALGFMVFSSLGLWAMGPIMVLGLRRSVWYHLAVQFYLHFQFYGWFTFALFALLFKFFEDQKYPWSHSGKDLLSYY